LKNSLEDLKEVKYITEEPVEYDKEDDGKAAAFSTGEFFGSKKGQYRT